MIYCSKIGKEVAPILESEVFLLDRSEKILVVDVETANDVQCPLVYDIGVIVTNRHGVIFEARHFIIYDIYRQERALMDSCYYKDKLPQYEKLLAKGSAEIVRFYTARKEILHLIELYAIEKVAAYNCFFDRMALNNTLRWLTKSKYRYFFPRYAKFICIWHMACQMVCTQKKYWLFVQENGYKSARGNIQTNAETVYRYYTKSINFDEKHMGLDDAIIETFILAKCYAQHKKMNTGINRRCWQIPQRKEA